MSTEYTGWTITVTTDADSIGGADPDGCDVAAMDAAWGDALRTAFEADYPGADIVIDLKPSTLTTFTAWHASMDGDDYSDDVIRTAGIIERDAHETLSSVWADDSRWVAPA